MTALWSNDGTRWMLLEPSPFDAEASLHSLVEAAPHLLPLSGAPRLAVLGREVPLGSGYADLLAVETSGRLVLIEVNLAKNAEARRAVVAQVLAYAAFLHGLDAEALERDVLGPVLRGRGFESVQAAAAAVDQEGAFDATAFQQGLEESLASGAFRLVLVLDEAPAELVRLVGYLEHVGGELVIDLVTVSGYGIGGSQVLVPQRIEPERAARDVRRPESSVRKDSGYLADGVDDVIASIESAPIDHQQQLRRLAEWAIALEREGLVRLKTYHGKGRLTLLRRLTADDAGLVTVWNDNGPYLAVAERLRAASAAEHRPRRGADRHADRWGKHDTGPATRCSTLSRTPIARRLGATRRLRTPRPPRPARRSGREPRALRPSGAARPMARGRSTRRRRRSRTPARTPGRS